jgi:hypothetical protein
LSKCLTCGADLGFFSFSKECITCKMNREAGEAEKNAELEKVMVDHIQRIITTDSSELLPTIPPYSRANEFIVKVPSNEKIFLIAGSRVLEKHLSDQKFKQMRLSFDVNNHITIHGSDGRLVPERRFIETTEGVLMFTNKRVIVNPFKSGKKPIILPYNKIEGYNIAYNQIEFFTGKEFPIVIEINEMRAGIIQACRKILELHA